MITALLSLSGCQSLWYLFLDTVVDIAPNRFTFEGDHKKLSIPIYSSHPLKENDNELDHLIVIIHGAGLNAGKAFETGQQLIKSLKIDKSRMMILVPQFLEGVKVDEIGLLFWDRKWRDGGVSLSTRLNKDLPNPSSFEVLDHLINVVTKQNPNMERIIILGHSAGGQFVLRYAAINNRHELYERQGVFIRYIVANPSSYLYLDETRYKTNENGEIIETSREELADCSSYNKYKYGLEELYGYAETLSPQIIRTRLLTRPIMFVVGMADKDRDWGLDKSCEADLQGKNRYERGLLNMHHLRSFVKNSRQFPHIWIEIPEVGHEAAKIFNHPRFITELKALDF